MEWDNESAEPIRDLKKLIEVMDEPRPRPPTLIVSRAWLQHRKWLEEKVGVSIEEHEDFLILIG